MPRRFSRRRFGRSRFKTRFTRRHRTRGVEGKSVDQIGNTTFTFGNFHTAAGTGAYGIQLLNTPIVGAAFYNRIGSRIRMKSVDLRIQFLRHPLPLGSTYSENGTIYRMALIYDAQFNGAYPAWNDIFLNYDISGTPQGNILSMINMNNRSRFLVLRDWTFSTYKDFDTGGVAPQDLLQPQMPRSLHWFQKLKNLETIYKASTGSVGDVATGALLLVWGAYCETAGDLVVPALAFEVNTRLRFFD